MAGFDRGYRQKVIDEYLSASGANFFVPAEFLEWLRDRPDHRVYSVFFGKSDEDAAHEYRLMLARQFVSGLRFKVTVTPAMASSSPHISIQVREPTTFRVPAFVSPVAGRKEGGGYYQTDVTETETAAELYRQAAQSLASWLERHADVARLAGADIGAVERVLGTLSAAGTIDTAAEAA
jgi:hypothetical protein